MGFFDRFSAAIRHYCCCRCCRQDDPSFAPLPDYPLPSYGATANNTQPTQSRAQTMLTADDLQRITAADVEKLDDPYKYCPDPQVVAKIQDKSPEELIQAINKILAQKIASSNLETSSAPMSSSAVVSSSAVSTSSSAQVEGLDLLANKLSAATIGQIIPILCAIFPYHYYITSIKAQKQKVDIKFSEGSRLVAGFTTKVSNLINGIQNIYAKQNQAKSAAAKNDLKVADSEAQAFIAKLNDF